MPGLRRHVVSIIVVLLVMGGLLGLAFGLGLRPRLGLDLRGGVSVTLTAPDDTDPEVLDKTVEVLQRRVDQAGVAEPEIASEGSTNVLIQLPGTEDPQRLLDLIGRTAQLQFRQVLEIIPEGAPGYATATVTEADTPEDEVVYTDEVGTKYRLAPSDLTGAAVRDGTAVLTPDGLAWEVNARFDRDGSETWEEFTGRLACLPLGSPDRQVAIVLDRRVESSPQIAEDVECEVGITGGTTVITGDFDEEEARDLAIVLTTGALPVQLEQSEVRLVSPTLGSDSLRAGLLAGALGLALVMLFVLLYYRSLGLQTWLTYLVFGGIIYGLIVLLGEGIGWSLTLAGIAGLIVAIGIATDSNIVFFERIREEVQEGRTVRTSVGRGFGPAWRTLVAANFVTILAAIVLYFLAVGPVRGFALALGVATALDLVITYGLTWPMASVLAGSRFFSEGRVIGMRPALEGRSRSKLLSRMYQSQFHMNIMGRRRWWAAVSGAALLISLLAFLPQVRGLSFGIDFRGGNILRSPAPEGLTVSDVRDTMRQAGRADAVVQIVEDPTTGRRQVQVQTGAVDVDERDEVIQALVGVTGAEAIDVDVQSVGEKWGEQITQKAVRGLLIFLVLVVLYMSLRLEPKMAVSGLAALVHDLVITAGVYAIVGFEVTPAAVIAILTIMGYSLYDTVVVFDKVQENMALPSNARRAFADVANDSVNQVLMRSINTSLTTLLPVGSLLFVGSALLGAETLKDLALALFVGVGVGTYSSVFVAAPLLTVWKEREPRYSGVRARVLDRALKVPGRDTAERKVQEPAEATAGEEEPLKPLEEEEAEAVLDELEAEEEDDDAIYHDEEYERAERVQPKRLSRRERKKRRR